MTHDYKYENMNEEDRNALIPAIRHTPKQPAQHTPGPWTVDSQRPDLSRELCELRDDAKATIAAAEGRAE